MNKFSTENYFDISEFPFRDIFQNKEPIWEVLKRINSFIISLFEQGVVTENFAGRRYVYIGEGSQIFEGAFITGPCIIGKNSIIGHVSLLRENCLIGDNVRIGHGVEVKNSIFLNNSTAAHLNYIGDSIIGNGVNIAGGAMVANFRFDQKEIMVKDKENFIVTHLKKMGAIIGDDCQIGANAVLNPGTVFGKQSIVYPLTSVRGIHDKNSVVE